MAKVCEEQKERGLLQQAHDSGGRTGAERE